LLSLGENEQMHAVPYMLRTIRPSAGTHHSAEPIISRLRYVANMFRRGVSRSNHISALRQVRKN